MALLEARGLTVTYGGLNANDEIDLECESGKLVGLIGPNGAGKTTFIDAITGFTPVTHGYVSFDGVDLNGLRPDARAKLGLVRTFQSLELFEDLTVRDNLLVAADRPRWYSFLSDIVLPSRGKAAALERIDVALNAMELGDLADTAPERPQPRPAQARRCRPGTRRQPEAAAARRAGCRTRHEGEPTARGSPSRLPRSRREPVPDRPRHGTGAECLRLHLRPRLRTGDRARHPRPGPCRSLGHRCLPRRVRRRGSGRGRHGGESCRGGHGIAIHDTANGNIGGRK